MMGRQIGDQASLFYEFRLDDRVPKEHLLRRINRFLSPVLGGLHAQLQPYYSEIGRPSIDPELMIRMLIVGYCYGVRSERKLSQEVELHLAYRWFCRLDLDDKVPHHSTFSENRLHRFRQSDVFRQIFERVVAACMAAGLVKGEGFAVDASVMEANASRYHGKAPDEIEWVEPERQTRAVKEYLAALEAESDPNPDRKPPKVISPSDPQSAWTAKANNCPEAQAAGRRYGLRDWPFPGLVGRPQDRTAHPGSRCQRARRWYFLSPRLSLGQTAGRLHLPEQQGVADHWHGA